MKKLYGNYLGLCINNDDPEKRGRVQVFVPHIMPALYEDWNDAGEDIKMLCIGDNLPDSIPAPIVEKLIKILPWAESASPILGTSSPGNLITNAANTVGAAVNNFFNQSPMPDAASALPTGGGYVPGVAGIGNENALLSEALKYAGSGDLGSRVRGRLTTPGSRGGGACGRGTIAVVGALTNNSEFKQGTAGGNAKDYSGNNRPPTDRFARSGIYQPRQAASSSYLSDPSQWRVGDVIASGGGSNGHIQVWTGKQWVSDFQQGKKILTNGYNNFTLHRLNAQGEQAVSARAGLFGGLVGGPGLPSPAEPPNTVEKSSTSGQVAAPTPHQDENSLELDLNKNNYGNIAKPEVSLDAPVSLALNEDSPQSDTGSGLYSDNFVNFIKAKEGYYEKPYWDYKQWTSGYGTKASGPNEIIDKATAESRLRSELNQAASQTNTILAKKGINGLTQSQREALYSFTYNGGSGMLTSLLDGGGGRTSWGEISQGMLLYNKAGGKTLAGLVNRRNDEIAYGNTNGAEGFTPTAEQPTSSSVQSQSLVNNTDKHGAMAVLNLNNMAKGVFTYPAAGALLWVFFREGNPLFPVYFAASYGEREWASAFRLGSEGAAYSPAPTPEKPSTSTGGVMNLNGVGGMRWEDTNVPDDPTRDQKSLTLFGYDGSNIHFNEGYHQFFSKFDRRDSVEGDRWETTLGFKEEWVQGDSNEVTMGDVFVKIGNVSPPAVDAVTRIQQIIKECMEPVTQSSGGSSSSSASQSGFSKAAQNASQVKVTPIGAPPSRTGGQTDSPSQIIANIKNQQAKTIDRGTFAEKQQQEAAAREFGFAR